jgi:ribosome-binding factor A
LEQKRQSKIERLLQKELSLMLEAETRKTHGIMLSVSEVRVSSDLSYCTAYISVFPSERGDEIIANLKANVKSLRYDLGQRLRHQLRIIPELRFFKDETLDYMEHIDELLKK